MTEEEHAAFLVRAEKEAAEWAALQEAEAGLEEESASLKYHAKPEIVDQQ